MRKDKKKDFYFLMNGNRESLLAETLEKDRTESKSTRQNSSFIFSSNSKKSEKVTKKPETSENSLSQKIDINTPTAESVEKKTLAIQKNNENIDTKIDVLTAKQSTNDFDNSTNITSLKSLKEEKIETQEKIEKSPIIEKIVVKPKKQEVENIVEEMLDNFQLDIKDIQKNETKRKFTEKPSKVKNSILSHWETKTVETPAKNIDQDEFLTNLSITKDENNPFLVII